MQFFNQEYLGLPLWEIGRPQPAFVRLEEEGRIVGRVLDVGCGTGENALFFAERGHDTWGVDFAANAIRRARAKASARGVSVTFREANALELAELGEEFDTVTDCGLFHTLLDHHRPMYAASLGSVLRPGGRLLLLCFSEDEPTDWGGPRRVSREELERSFRQGWKLAWVRRDRFQVRLPHVEGRAWLASFVRQ
jgi:cyclopropane fatty-acyl-phospholipid synthase-like methyltransferase